LLELVPTSNCFEAHLFIRNWLPHKCWTSLSAVGVRFRKTIPIGDKMTKKHILEKLAFPMFAAGTLAMILAASISVSAAASASDPVTYKKVTLNYLSSGYSGNSSSCGNYQDSYGSSAWNTPSFSGRDSSNSLNQKQIMCQVTLYVVTGVQIPSPSPAPTVTVIYKSAPTSNPQPSRTETPTSEPKPTPTPVIRPTRIPIWPFIPTPAPTNPKRTR
jgi:hypothetical protein